MRMWMIDPNLLCNQHLLGEHNEIHKHRHNFEKRHKINGRISPVTQIEPKSMKTRHDQIAIEMVKRNMNHKSEYIMPDISYLTDWAKDAKVDIDISIKDLCERCEDCKDRIRRIKINIIQL